MTQPSLAMREAMAAAEVGDDDYQEDPTVERLEQRAAALLGKDAGLFVPSGIMSNLIAALAHCPEDRRVIAVTNAHLAWSLTGNPRIARLVHLTAIASDARGLPEREALATELDASAAPRVGLVCFENTHNQAGGTALRPEEAEALTSTAHDHGLPVHLDGARLFNAAVALGVSPSALALDADSVTFCVSKGLGAPVGSVLCGDSAFIERARDFRKWLGGTMRQAGIIASAGLFALDHQVERLDEDHGNARWLAKQLSAIPGLTVTPVTVETNILFIEPTGMETGALGEALRSRGVLTIELNGRLRLVTHLNVNRAHLTRAVEIIRDVVVAEAGLPGAAHQPGQKERSENPGGGGPETASS